MELNELSALRADRRSRDHTVDPGLPIPSVYGRLRRKPHLGGPALHCLRAANTMTLAWIFVAHCERNHYARSNKIDTEPVNAQEQNSHFDRSSISSMAKGPVQVRPPLQTITKA